MALSVNGGGGYGSRRRGGGASLSEINITPFVDVVLVLLIIFMLTAHVMEFGIEVDVPKVQAVKDTAQELPVVTITKDGTTYLNDKPVNINDLQATIRAQLGNHRRDLRGPDVQADNQIFIFLTHCLPFRCALSAIRIANPL